MPERRQIAASNGVNGANCHRIGPSFGPSSRKPLSQIPLHVGRRRRQLAAMGQKAAALEGKLKSSGVSIIHLR